MDGDTRTARQTNWETPATSNQPAAQDEAPVGGGMAAPAIPGRTAAHRKDLERHYGEHCLQFGTHQSPYQDPVTAPIKGQQGPQHSE